MLLAQLAFHGTPCLTVLFSTKNVAHARANSCGAVMWLRTDSRARVNLKEHRCQLSLTTSTALLHLFSYCALWHSGHKNHIRFGSACAPRDGSISTSWRFVRIIFVAWRKLLPHQHQWITGDGHFSYCCRAAVAAARCSAVVAMQA
jgi:hypothetical protein